MLANSILKNQLYSSVEDTAGYSDDLQEEESKYHTFSHRPRKLNVLGITSVNCEQWVVTDLASNLLGITSVPLYETLGT